MALDTDKHSTNNFCPVLFPSHLSKDSVLVRDRIVTGFHAELNLLDFIIKFIIKSSLNADSSSILAQSTLLNMDAGKLYQLIIIGRLFFFLIKPQLRNSFF